MHSLLQLMRPSVGAQVAVPALIQQLDQLGPIVAAREECARPLPPPPQAAVAAAAPAAAVEDAVMEPVPMAGKRPLEATVEEAGEAEVAGASGGP